MAVSSSKLTKQLSAEVANAQLERAKTEALFASLGEGLLAADEHGLITRVNQIALDILGYSKKEMLGSWFTERIRALNEDGSPVNEVDRPSVRALITGKTINEHIYSKTRNDELIPLAVSMSPIMWRGKPRGIIMVFRDITTDILNDKMKTDFISIASHQLRTPLSSINTYAHMIGEGYAGHLNKTQQTFIKTILSATERMNELISTLLNITRIESGNIIIKNKPLKLNDCVREIVTEFKPHISERQIALKLKAQPQLPLVYTDKVLVREVLVNLLSNAIKYTGESGSILVELYEDHKNLVVHIHDTGYGIPAIVQSQIFNKFFRASNITGKDVTGTGLGLYLTKVLAELLKGDVWFKSVENKGTDFYFSLPKRPTSNSTPKIVSQKHPKVAK